MSTVYERRVLIPFENRTVTIDRDADNRTVHVAKENRTIFIERTTTSAERTVYATED